MSYSTNAFELTNTFLGKCPTLPLDSICLELKALPLVSSRWRYSTSCWFLLPALSGYICELALSTFHHLSGVLPGALVVPACGGHWCLLCHWHHFWGTRIGGPSAISGVSCVAGSAAAARGWRWWSSQGQGSLCYVWDSRVCGSHCCGQRWGVRVPPRLEGQSHWPRSHCCLVPWVTGITVAQRLKLWVLPPLMRWCSLGQ